MRKQNVGKSHPGLKNCDPRSTNTTNSTITINDIQNTAVEEHWPNEHFRKAIKEQISELQPIQAPNHYIHAKLRDITDSQLGVELARDYEPRITLLGRGLIAEKNSDLWGGMLVRVLSDEEENGTPSNVVIQYLYTWIQQHLPFTFWNWLLPLLVLIIMSVYFNTDTLIYSPDWEAIESFILIPFGEVILEEILITPLANVLTKDFYPIIPISISLIGLVIGGYQLINALRKNRIFSQGSLILLLLGGLSFASLMVEFLFWPTPLTTIIVSHSLSGSDITVSTFRIGSASFILLIAFLFSAAIIKFQDQVLTISWLNRGLNKVRKLVGIHPMDYAPIFIYLQKHQENGSLESGWNIVNIKWDKIHHCIKALTPTDVSKRFKPALTEKYNFAIKGSWHAFELITPQQRIKYIRRWRISATILTILLGVTLYVTLYSINFIGIFENMAFGFLNDQNLSKAITVIILKGLYSVLLLSSLIYSVVRWPRNIDIDQDFSEIKFYHLTCPKLQVLWNLPGDAEFLIQDKLQDPIAGTQGEGAKSFYNTGHTKEKVC